MVYIQYMTNTNRIQNLELTNPRQREQTVVTLHSGQHVLVSTVLLMSLRLMSHSREEYETMTFPADETGMVLSWTELDCKRYDSEEDAFAGHAMVVMKWHNTDSTVADLIPFVFEANV
jgi:hypothetical protein